MSVDRESLRRWVASVVGAADVALTRLPGGGRNEAWRVEPTDPTDDRSWFLRVDPRPPSPHEQYTLRREADLYRAVGSAGVPVPAVLGVHPEVEAVVLEHVPGTARFAGLDPATQQDLVDELVGHLARMHEADPASLPLGSLGPVKSVDDHVIDELDRWQYRLDASGLARPFYTACFQWLRANQIRVERTPALVQGDTGPGNFLHDGSRITALLDFELGHLGDPLEDLAWIATRNAQEPVPDFDLLCRRYEEAGGEPIDARRLRYHLLFAELRIAVLYVDRESATPVPTDDLGNQLIYGALHRRLTVEAMAAALGIELPHVDLGETPPPTDNGPYFDAVATQLREIVLPAVNEPFANRRAKSMARVVKYLSGVDRYGERPARSELADLTTLLGHEPVSIEGGRLELERLVRAGEVDVVDLLPYAWRQVTWTNALVGPAMGALATRHLPGHSQRGDTSPPRG